MKVQDIFQKCGRFPKINIIKMQEEASAILGWKCEIVPAEKPYVCKYCGQPIEKFKVKKYRVCNQCYNDKYNKEYYEENKDYFKEKNEERYEKDPQAQKERVKRNEKKHEGYFLYKLFLKDRLVYIGSTLNLYKRADVHVHDKTKNFDKMIYIQLPKIRDNRELKWLEHYLIRAGNKPEKNVKQNIKYEIEIGRQQELLEMEKKGRYNEYALIRTKKCESN